MHLDLFRGVVHNQIIPFFCPVLSENAPDNVFPAHQYKFQILVFFQDIKGRRNSLRRAVITAHDIECNTGSQISQLLIF